MVKLQQMSQLVSQANDITERELKFIESYPLASLMETQAAGLLKKAKQIMENLVSEFARFIHTFLYFYVYGGRGVIHVHTCMFYV